MRRDEDGKGKEKKTELEEKPKKIKTTIKQIKKEREKAHQC